MKLYINKIKERRRLNAVCPRCKSPDYSYQGRAEEPDGKHMFHCNSCDHQWQYGNGDSNYLKLK